MHLPITTIALFALVMSAGPAKADLVFVFLDSPTQVINDFVPFGNQSYDNGSGLVSAAQPLNNPFAAPGPAQAGSIMLQAGQTRIIQVALLDTFIGNVFPPIPGGNPNANPASSIPPQGVYNNPRWLSTATGTANIPQMFGMSLWGSNISWTVLGPTNNPTGGAFIAPPYPLQGVGQTTNGNNRLSLVHPSATFRGGQTSPLSADFGGIVSGNGAIPNRNYFAETNQPEIGGRFALFNFEITTVPTDPGGVYPITLGPAVALVDNFVSSTGAGGVGTTSDNIFLDTTIFSPLHPNYVLNVTVTPVPEPSSIALAGLALAGLGYKLRRKLNRVRNLAIALFAIMANTVPARADLVLLFLDSPFGQGSGTFPNQINNFIPLGNQPFTHINGIDPPVSVPAVAALNNPLAPTGMQAGSISMTAGEKRIIQLALLDTLIGNTYPPFNAGGPPDSSIPTMGVSGTTYNNPRWLSTSTGTAPIPQMFGLHYWETRMTGTVVGLPGTPIGGAFIAPPGAVPGIDPDNGNQRISLVNPYAAFFNAGSMPPFFSDFGGLLITGNGGIPNYDYAQGTSRLQLGGRLALFNFEITTVATDPGGVYPITVSDRSTFHDFEVRNANSLVGMAGDRIALDSIIFGPAHPTYTLNVIVNPVPEPSSMAFAGMALAGLGYKLRRKMKAKAQATA